MAGYAKENVWNLPSTLEFICGGRWEVGDGCFMELNGHCNDMLAMEVMGVRFRTMPYRSQDKATYRSRDYDRGAILRCIGRVKRSFRRELGKLFLQLPIVAFGPWLLVVPQPTGAEVCGLMRVFVYQRLNWGWCTLWEVKQ